MSESRLQDGWSWIIGLPAVIAATFSSLFFAPQRSCPISLPGLIRFIPFFLNLSFWGGCDVMRRALSPAMPMNPGLVHYQVSLPEVFQQVLLINCISLLPGTISADFDKQCVTIHAIDRDMPVWSMVHLLERRVAALFGISMAGGGECHELALLHGGIVSAVCHCGRTAPHSPRTYRC